MNHLQALQFFDSLAHAATPAELHAYIAEAVQELGFEHYLCGLSSDLNKPNPSVFALNGVSPEWWDRYQSQAYLAVDPTVRVLLKEQRAIPLPWWEIQCANPGEKGFMNDAEDHGMTSGISFSLNARNEVGIFSLILKHRPRRIREHIVNAMPLGNLLAAYVQEAGRRLMASTPTLSAIRLTPRETECLLWASVGKTAWETAKILGISERTVVFHLGNAAQKLGVSNRRQAIARAIVEGLIQP